MKEYLENELQFQYENARENITSDCPLIEDELFIKLYEERQLLLQALNDIRNPIGYLQREAEKQGGALNASAFEISQDVVFVRQIAIDALNKIGK